jgi:hypothetical protein
MGTPGITDPFLNFIDTQAAESPTEPFVVSGAYSEGMNEALDPAWNDPLNQAVSPLAGSLTQADILTDPASVAIASAVNAGLAPPPTLNVGSITGAGATGTPEIATEAPPL